MPTPERLQPGDMAPDFTLASASGTNVGLRDLLGQKTILYFFPVAGTLTCTREARNFNDALPEFESLGYRIVGASPDPVEKLANFSRDNGLEFTVLSDPDIAVHKRYGAWGEKSIIGRLYKGVLRSTIIFDETGKVQHALYAVKVTDHVNDLLKLLR